MKCKKHPKYQVKRKPVSDCVACWKIWAQALTGDNRALSRLLHICNKALLKFERSAVFVKLRKP